VPASLNIMRGAALLDLLSFSAFVRPAGRIKEGIAILEEKRYALYDFPDINMVLRF